MRHHTLRTNSDIESMLDYVKANQFSMVAFDLETDSVEETKAKVYGIGFAFDEEDAFYIPVRNNKTELLWENEKYLAKFLTDFMCQMNIIGHNVIYDCLVWEHNYGLDLSKYVSDDTILLKHCIDEEQPFGLKETAVKYLGAWADKAQQKMIQNIKDNGGEATKSNMQMFLCDTEVLAEYCAWDVLLTFKLFNLFKPQLKAQNLEALYNEEVMPLYKEVTIPMKRKGLRIDQPFFETLRSDIVNEILELERAVIADISPLITNYEKETLEKKAPIKKTGSYPKFLAQELQEILPDSLARKIILQHDYLVTVQWLLGTLELPGTLLLDAQKRMFFSKYPDQRYIFNLRSKDNLKHLFFEILEETPLSKTETGEPQVDDDFLASVSKKYPWVIKLQDLNKLEKIRGTYIDGILDRQEGGYIYTSLLQFGTTSGRYASRNPNLQNLPRPKEDDSGLSELVLKYTNSIRKGFIAPQEYVFIDADYSALEPRCFAHMSGDNNLQMIFHNGEDMYSAIAKRVFKLENVGTYKKDPNFLGKLYPEKRQIIKALALAVTYGAEAFRIGELLGVHRNEAQQLIDDYLNTYPGLKSYIKNCHKEAITDGQVCTIFGRIRHLPSASALYADFGSDIADAKWAKIHGLSEERREYKNKLNNSTNFKIQGLAAHIVNRAMINITRKFKQQGIDGWVTLQVHDQIIAAVRKDQSEQAKKIVQECMETVANLSVPLIAEPKIAYNLKDSH